MNRSVTTATIAILGAAAFALTLGVGAAVAESGSSAKFNSSKGEHGYGHSGYRGHSSGHPKGYSKGHSKGHSNGHHNYRPSYGRHGSYGRGGHSGHGGYGGHGYRNYDGHGYRGSGHYYPRGYGHGGYASHKGYYCSRCQYRTTSYSIFYSHVYHHHQVPWYDIAALIVFDPVTLVFSFGGHGGHH